MVYLNGNVSLKNNINISKNYTYRLNDKLDAYKRERESYAELIKIASGLDLEWMEFYILYKIDPWTRTWKRKRQSN